MKKSFMTIIILILFFQYIYAEETKLDFNSLKYLEAEDERIHLKIDFELKKISIEKLIIKEEIPLGRLQLNFNKKYIVSMTGKKIIGNEVTISGSDYYDGIGTEIKIAFFNGGSKATIFIDSYYEELSINFSPQLVPFKLIYKQ